MNTIMQPTIRLLSASGLATALILTIAAATNAAETSRVYVKFKPGQRDAARALVQQAGGRIHHEFGRLNGTTDEPATSVVILNGQTYSDTNLVTSHSRTFQGRKRTTYTCYVSSVDAASHQATAGPFTHQN